jgi:hypothetical protein
MRISGKMKAGARGTSPADDRRDRPRPDGHRLRAPSGRGGHFVALIGPDEPSGARRPMTTPSPAITMRRGSPGTSPSMPTGRACRGAPSTATAISRTRSGISVLPPLRRHDGGPVRGAGRGVRRCFSRRRPGRGHCLRPCLPATAARFPMLALAPGTRAALDPVGRLDRPPRLPPRRGGAGQGRRRTVLRDSGYSATRRPPDAGVGGTPFGRARRRRTGGYAGHRRLLTRCRSPTSGSMPAPSPSSTISEAEATALRAMPIAHLRAGGTGPMTSTSCRPSATPTDMADQDRRRGRQPPPDDAGEMTEWFRSDGNAESERACYGARRA